MLITNKKSEVWSKSNDQNNLVQLSFPKLKNLNNFQIICQSFKLYQRKLKIKSDKKLQDHTNRLKWTTKLTQMTKEQTFTLIQKSGSKNQVKLKSASLERYFCIDLVENYVKGTMIATYLLVSICWLIAIF